MDQLPEYWEVVDWDERLAVKVPTAHLVGVGEGHGSILVRLNIRGAKALGKREEIPNKVFLGTGILSLTLRSSSCSLASDDTS